MLDPRRLLVFARVAEHRSFSRAADSLSLTQSAVSQQVAALEREAGTRLIDRRRGGLALTDAGARLLQHARALDAGLRRADAELAELVAAERRELRLGAYPSALATLVAPAVSAVLQDDPALELTVDEGTAAELEDRVRDGRLHLALGFQDAGLARREPDGLVREDLASEPMVALVAPRHRLARRRRVALADLAAERWTAPSRDGLIDRACRAAGFRPQIAVLTRDPLAIRAVVAAGLAVTLTPRSLAAQLGDVRALELGSAAPRRTIYALRAPTGARPPAARLLEALRTTVPANAALEAPGA